jgi:Mn-dependent DtxR family transcriptional regulator
MTPRLIAHMLGAAQHVATEAALKLQDAGLIQYEGGRIWVMDRSGLEQRSCECYEVVKQEYDRLLRLPLAAKRTGLRHGPR